MGKASSAKKVARAARAGGRVSGVRQRNLLFPGAVGAVVLLGSVLLVLARMDHTDDASNVPPLVGDHWHSAYGIYVCDNFIPTVPASENTSTVGIHTHGDGVVHIHPFSQGGAGENATLGTFLEDTEIELSDDELRVGEESWKEGEDTCGDEDAELVVARWKGVQSSDEDPALIREDFEDLRFREDGEGYTIAFVPEGTTDIPKPGTAGNLTELGAVDAGQDSPDFEPSTTTVPGETVPGEPPVPGETTLPPDPSAETTVPPETTPTTAAGE